MMCADYGNLRNEMQTLEEAGIDMFHIDIMDGQFVPNFGMGLQDVEFLCSNASIPVDVHLMIVNPGTYVEKFVQLGAKIIYIHPEAELHSPRTLQMITDSGAVPAIAINPGTAVKTIRPLLSFVKYVMIMGVNPGFAGQKYITYVDEKIEELLMLKDRYEFDVMLDGACSPERIQTLGKIGVKGFVLGTSALFGKGSPYKEIISELKEL